MKTQWYVKTESGQVEHEKCSQRYVQSSHQSGSVTTNWYACGHPAAVGVPCVYWGCPIACPGPKDEVEP